MKLVFILLTIHLYVYPCFAQKTDYYKKAEECISSNIDSSYIYINNAIKNANPKKELVASLILKQQIANIIGMPDTVASLFTDIYSILTEISNDSTRSFYHIQTANMEANVFFSNGNNRKADSCWNFVNELSVKYKLSQFQIPTLINLGLLKRSEGNLIESFNYYQQALCLCDSLKNFDMKFSVLNMMGQILIEVGNPDKGLEYFNDAGKFEDSVSFIGYISEWKSDIGYAWFNKNVLDSSLFYYKQAYDIALIHKLPLYRALSCTNIGEIQLKTNDTEAAKINIENGLRLFGELHAAYGEFYARGLLGEYYFIKGQYSKAEKCFTESEKQIAQLNVIVELQKRHYERVYKLYKKTGNYKMALSAYEKYKGAEYAIQNKEVVWKIGHLEKDLDLAKKEQIIEDQKQNLIIKDYNIKLIKNKAYIYLMAGFSILLILISFIIINTIKRNKDKQIYKSEVEQLITRYKLQNIHSQLSPHFIFNALNNFWHIIESKNKDYTYKYLTNLSGLLRTVLVNSEKTTITLKEELDFIKNFLDLEKINQHNKFEYSIDIAKDISIYTPIIPMCIQTHVENALKHGINPKPTKGNILISIQNNENHMLVRIEDDGIGREKSLANKTISTGIGIRSQKEIIDLFNTKNLSKINLNIIDLMEDNNQNSGTRVEIKIPFRYSYSFN